MAVKKISKAKPGSTRTRKVTSGPGKGDTVRFKANSSSARQPGKLNPKRVVKDVKPKRAKSSAVKKGKSPIKSKKR